MDTTQGMTLVPTTHSLKMILSKGFTGEQISSTFRNPSSVYASRNHPGQYRVTGNGVCLVGVPQGDKFRLITVYEDRVITALRPDQIDAGVKIKRVK